MTRPKTAPPLASFSATMIDALVEGSKRVITYNGSYATLVRLRQRLYQCRKALEREKDPRHTAAAKVIIRITKAEPSTLTISPQDDEFAAILGLPTSPQNGAAPPSLEDELDAIRNPKEADETL